MGVDISRVRRRLFLISFIELFLNFRCDDAFGTMSPLSLPSPASKVVPRGRNPGSCMMCGRVVPTWSNPSGAVLVEVAGGKVWAAERPFMWNSVDVGPPRAPGGGLCFLTHPIVPSVRIGCGVVQTHVLRPDGGRMAVVKLADGSLWVHSPVELDAPLRQALEELGPVRHIVSPNYEHVKYAQQWVEAFPSARSYACPGLIERRPEIGFGREVGNVPVDKTPPEWGGEIEACFVDCEKNPFTGKPFFNEVVFFHRPSRTLITADLFWNYPRSVPFKTRAWKWGMDKVYHPFYKRFMITDKAGFDAKVKSILDWGIEVIIPCHGDVVRSGASEALRDMLLGAGPK